MRFATLMASKRLWCIKMMNEFKARIERAKKPKHLEKVRLEALQKYGFFSKEYGEIITLCYAKLETLKGN